MYNNKKLALSIFWVLLGIVLIGLSVMEVLDNSIYAGMGGALIGVGILQIVRIVRYKRDAGYREKIDTEIDDERNKFLRMKSWSWTGYVVVIAEAIGSVIAMVMEQHQVQMILSYSVCLMLVVYWIAYLICSRKY